MLRRFTVTNFYALYLFLPSVQFLRIESFFLKELEGFLELQVIGCITISKEALSFYDEASSSWKAEAGKFEALVGNAADNLKLKKAFELF